MADTKQNFTTPVGRIVGGSLYNPRTTDIEGKPLVYRHGTKIGQARVDYFVALALPKGAEKAWYETSWGQTILQVAATCFPQACQSPTFAWKVEDGDSQVPNGKGHKNSERTGYPGHWILKLGGDYAPKTYQLNGTGGLDQIMQADVIKPGYYVQVVITVDGNKSDLKPGIKLYHSTVCLRAVHEEITWGPDVSAAGFGAAPLPAGVSNVPPALTVPMPAGALGVPALPALPSAPVVPSPSITASVPVPALPVIPNPGFLTAAVPAVPVPPVPIAPPAPAASPSRTLTAKANGASYEALVANGWSDDLLRAHGMMV